MCEKVMLQDWQERVVHEEQALNEKLLALINFNNSDAVKKLPIDEQDRLKRQENAMTEYSVVLRERIDNFDC